MNLVLSCSLRARDNTTPPIGTPLVPAGISRGHGIPGTASTSTGDMGSRQGTAAQGTPAPPAPGPRESLAALVGAELTQPVPIWFLHSGRSPDRAQLLPSLRFVTLLSPTYLFQLISCSSLQPCDKASPGLCSLDFIVSDFYCVLNYHVFQ